MAKTHVEGKSVAVKVVHSTKPRPAHHRVTPVPKKIATPHPTPAPVAPSIFKQSVHELPLEHRRKVMWSVVAIGMVIIVTGWALTLSFQLRQGGGESQFLKDVSSLFSQFPFKSQASNSNQEIRSLEKEIFPQFQQ